MKNLLRLMKQRLVPRFRKDDYVEINENGFWKNRSNQMRSLHYTANEFNKMGGKTILEIGSGIHGPMAGNSIIVWASRTKAERILAVDLDPDRIREVESAAGHFSAVKAILADGRDIIRDLDETIDLLYLDFWTPDEAPSKLLGTARAESYLEIYDLAKPKLSANALILIDDSDHIDPWKQTYIVPAARLDGFRVLYVGRQTLLQRQNAQGGQR